MEIRIAKLFVEVGDYYVFSEKKKLGSSSNHLLELIGGRIARDETQFQGLLRELEEEDLSGILTLKSKQEGPAPKHIIVFNESHAIYKITINNDEYKKLKYSPDESYGFHKIEDRLINNKDLLKKNISRFTNKTVAIFKELELL